MGNLSSVMQPVSLLIGNALTLYMLALLLRWAAPYLSINVYSGWGRWLRWITDPLVNSIRRLLPPLGPMDYAPWAAVLGMWFLRVVLVGW